MTEPLYRRNGGAPAKLPANAFDPNGFNWSDLANSPEGRAACGFVPAPAKPDPSAIWYDEAWIVVSAPSYDPATEVLTDDLTNVAIDRKTATGTAVYGKRPLTADEIAARQPAMPDISDRQFARGLWGDKVITYDDFLGFVGPGAIPAPLQAIVNTLPDDATGDPTPRKDAIGFLTGAKTYQFAHPLVDIFRRAIEAKDPTWTAAHLRERWLVWATL